MHINNSFAYILKQIFLLLFFFLTFSCSILRYFFLIRRLWLIYSFLSVSRPLCFLQVLKPLNHVLSSLVDQEAGHQLENDNLSSDELHRSYSVDEFEVRVLEPEKSGAPWQTRATIPMQTSENALTVRVVTLFVS